MNPICVLGNKEGFLKQAKERMRDYRLKCHINQWIVNLKKKKSGWIPKGLSLLTMLDLQIIHMSCEQWRLVNLEGIACREGCLSY